jgi:hypothetical protein
MKMMLARLQKVLYDSTSRRQIIAKHRGRHHDVIAVLGLVDVDMANGHALLQEPGKVPRETTRMRDSDRFIASKFASPCMAGTPAGWGDRFYIGADRTGRLLEVVVLDDDGQPVAIHAMALRPKFYEHS